jgi:lipopolysaccharide assembly outer membrane protein LptD (OstA)/TolA-binding protein
MIGKLGFALAKAEGLPYSLADMNLKQNCVFFAGVLAVFALLTVTGCSTALPYRETRSGNYLYLNPFSYKPATPQEHLNYAVSLRERGHEKSARKQFQILVKRWPDSAEAPTAKQASADIYFEQGKNKKAFTAYEELIQQYYTGIKDYDSILDRQYTLATNEMNRKHMRWLFGGYRSPERAVPLFESIIQNAPQWERAPEMQYMIGQAYQKNDEQELAVVAYSTVEYRYPDSPFAEKAAIAKIESFKDLVESTPYSVDIREQAQLSAGLFPELYTNSQHIAEAQAFSTGLRDLSAGYNYEVGRFYERVPRPPRTNSAAIYYEKVIKNFGGTESAVQSAERLRVIFPGRAAVPDEAAEAPILPAFDAGSATGVEGAEVKPLPERITDDEAAIEVTADRMEYSGDLLIGEGNVALQQKGASLQADRVTVDSKSGEIHAKGNILMIREDNRWEGQELVYNYKTREGTFGKSFMYFEPAYITAGSTERISTNEFLMRNAMITTCSGENPSVYVKAKEVRVINDEGPRGALIKAKHVTFYVGPVPVFYTPYWHRHVGSSMFNVVVGYGGDFGAFIKVRATVHPTEWLTSKTHFDVYSKRGLGLGQDFAWQTPLGGGRIETYYINDNDPQNEHDPASYQNLIDSQRYRIKLTDREQIDDETYFATKLNWLSDPLITRDFFNTEYKEAANPENYAVVQRSAEDYAASLRVDHRLNDFYTTVNRMPELTYDRYRAQLGDSPFHFESQNNLAFLEVQNAETNIPPVLRGDNYHSGRFDTYNQLFLPLRFRDFFNVTPRAGYRGTWYSATGTNAADSADYRHIFELGTLTSFKAYKTLTDKSGFYGDGLRHIVEPYADYSWRPKPSIDPEDLPQFDSIDAFDEQNEVRLGIRNYLQTKRGAKRIVNFLDSDVYTVFRLDPATGERSFSNLVADAELSLTDSFFIQSDLEYNWYTHKLTPANARLKYVTDDQSEYSFEYRYLDGIRELFTPGVKLFPNEKWSYELSASYDRTYDEWYERKILVTHKFDCIGMGAGLKVNEYDETQFWIQLWLLAFPQESMDTGF